MTITYQRNRMYSLIVGTAQNAVEITGLQIRFKVRKTSSNKDRKNKAEVEIYNLSKEYQTLFEEKYVGVSLSVGYEDTGLKRLFSGQAFNVGTRKEGADTITKVELDELFKELNYKPVSKLIPAGKTVKNVIQELTKLVPEVSKSIFNGKNIEKAVIDGYPMSGTPRQILNELSTAYEIDWQIDDGTLFISDKGDSYTNNTQTAFLIHEQSGLIERPYWDARNVKDPEGRKIESIDSKGKSHKKTAKVKKKSLKFKVLLNPAIYAGTILKLEYPEYTGFYKVDEVKHSGDFRGEEWYSEVMCVERVLQ
jgi:hypothetical protein